MESAANVLTVSAASIADICIGLRESRSLCYVLGLYDYESVITSSLTSSQLASCPSRQEDTWH